MHQPSNTTLPHISLVLPAHNEEHRLGHTLNQYLNDFLERYHSSFEIIVVCNGCDDATAVVAHEWAKRWTQVRVLNILKPIGKGGAVLEGFRAARAREVLFADADAATESVSLFALLDGLRDHDVTIGSRRLPDSVIVRAQPPLRRLFGGAFAWLVRALFGLPFRDTQCGAKAFRRPAALALSQRVQEARWTFDVDLLLQARQLGLTVHEQPVVWADQDGSQLRLLPTAGQVLRALWRLKRRQRTVDARPPSSPPAQPSRAEP